MMSSEGRILALRKFIRTEKIFEIITQHATEKTYLKPDFRLSDTGEGVVWTM